MSRCAICDYVEGQYHGFAYVPRFNTKVRWRPTHKEFQCDECYNSISTYQDAFQSLEEGEIETLDDVPEDTPTVPEVRIK